MRTSTGCIAKRLISVALAAEVATATSASPARADASPENKALAGVASASSVEPAIPDGRAGACLQPALCAAANGNDGRDDTRWSALYADGEFWQVDVGRTRLVDSVSITWEAAYAKRYRIDTSLEGVTFEPAAQTQASFSPSDLAAPQRYKPFFTAFAPRAARIVRIVALGRATKFGVSFWEAQVFGPSDNLILPGTPQLPAALSPDGPASTVPAPPGSPTVPRPGSLPSPRPVPKNPPAAPGPLSSLVPLAIVRLTGAVSGRGSSIKLLSVRAPRKAKVIVRCRGRGCPVKVPVRRSRGREQRVRELQRTLRNGARIEIFVTTPRTYGKYTRFVIRRGRPPARIDRCVLNKTTKPIACPAG